jgi:hypothetical protein
MTEFMHRKLRLSVEMIRIVQPKATFTNSSSFIFPNAFVIKSATISVVLQYLSVISLPKSRSSWNDTEYQNVSYSHLSIHFAPV